MFATREIHGRSTPGPREKLLCLAMTNCFVLQFHSPKGDLCTAAFGGLQTESGVCTGEAQRERLRETGKADP
jgi:hypothetical protein